MNGPHRLSLDWPLHYLTCVDPYPPRWLSEVALKGGLLWYHATLPSSGVVTHDLARCLRAPRQNLTPGFVESDRFRFMFLLPF